jgi:Lipid A 3-O-deacylase (PagL)
MPTTTLDQAVRPPVSNRVLPPARPRVPRRTAPKRFPVALLASVALLAAPLAARAEDAVSAGSPPSRTGVQEWGVKLGYGTSQRGQVEIMPVYGQAGWAFPDVIDQPLQRHHIDFKWLVEGWLAGIHTPKSDAFEMGVNPITLKLAYDAGQQFVPFLQGGIGVMYTSLQDGLQLGGPFEFDELVGVGLDMFCTKQFALNLSYRYRHMSNASISSDNRGLDTQYVLFGIDLFPNR